jgi:hypothetical protein
VRYTDYYIDEPSGESSNQPSSLLQEAWQRVDHAADQLASSALYSGLQSPVIGASQLIDKLTGSNLERHCHFMEAPIAAGGFRSADWHLQQVGNAAGMIVPFLALSKFSSPVVNRVLGNSNTIGNVVAKSAMMGGMYEFAFHPSEQAETFWEDRARNATAGAVAFGTMAGGSNLLQRGNCFSNSFTNKVFSGFAAGLPAGALGTTVELGLAGKLSQDWELSAQKISEGAYGFAFVGGFLGATHAGEQKLEAWKDARRAEREGLQQRALDPSKPREFKIIAGMEQLDQFRQTASPFASLKVREVFENGKEGPKRTLLVQHDEPTSAIARKSDILAYCNPEAGDLQLASKHVLPGTQGSTWMTINETTGRITFNSGEVAPHSEALELSKDLRRILQRRGFDLAELPSEMLEFELSGERWRGNDCNAYGLKAKEGFAESVLKISRGNWEGDWGLRPFDARIVDIPGSNQRFFESESGNDYCYLQERVVVAPEDASGYFEFLKRLDTLGYEVIDPNGDYLKQIGKSILTGEWVVIDYDAVRRKGSHTHDVENAGKGGHYWDEIADRDARYNNHDNLSHMETLDPSQSFDTREAIDNLNLSAEDITRAESLDFSNPTEEVQELLRQLTDGLNSLADVEALQSAIVGDRGLALQQIGFVRRVAQQRGIPTNLATD